MKLILFNDETLGAERTLIDPPADIIDQAKHWREVMIERLADKVDAVMEKYAHDHDVSESDLVEGLRQGTLANNIVPVLCGSSLKNKGVQALLDAVCDYLPSPLDVPPVVGFHPEKDKQLTRKPSPDEPLAALAFKVAADQHSDLTYLRIYSGTLKSGQRVYNATQKKKENLTQLWRMHANARERVDLAEETVEQAQENLRLAEERYRVGAGTILETFQATASLTSAQASLIEARIDYLVNQADLPRATGPPIAMK